MSASAVAPRARQWVPRSHRHPPAVRVSLGVPPVRVEGARAAELEALHAYGAAVTAALRRVERGERLYSEFVVELRAHVKVLAALGVSVPAVGER